MRERERENRLIPREMKPQRETRQRQMEKHENRRETERQESKKQRERERERERERKRHRNEVKRGACFLLQFLGVFRLCMARADLRM